MGARDAIAKLLTGIRAFHSSPHDFDRFDLSKIGTGEGAQVYGHGLYFAENPKVSGQGGEYWNQFLNKFRGPESSAANIMKLNNFDRDAAIEHARRALAKEEEALRVGQYVPGNPETAMSAEQMSWHPALIAKQQEVLRMLESGQPVGPRTYEVNIKADPAHMLDWDKTLDKQNIWDRIPANVRDSIDEVYDVRGLNAPSDAPEAYKGKDLYKALTHHEVSDAFPSFPGENWDKPKVNASAFLDQVAGAPGIKYLDEKSRGRAADFATAERHIAAGGNPIASADEWRAELARLQQTPLTSNYVVFDPANVDILKKYGVVGAPAGALTMGALAGQDQYEVAQ